MENRRNYYRILQVQPDAPFEVIKASYRTMMQRLKMHPDLGGDHWDASLINEAYAMLSNSERRREYDHEQASLFQRGDQPPETVTDYPNVQMQSCLFCKHINKYVQQPLEQCDNCYSPLIAVRPDNDDHQQQRRYSRIARGGSINVYSEWPQHPVQARLVDLSPCGLRLTTQGEYHAGQMLKIETQGLTAVVKVCNAQGNQNVVLGLEILAAQFDLPGGTFIKTTA